MLSPDEREALQEIANVGMGQAGASIAQLLGEFVRLSIPRVLVLPAHEACSLLANAGAGGCVSAVRQGFHGDLRGEAIAIYAEKGWNELADLMGYEAGDCPTESEILLDVSN